VDSALPLGSTALLVIDLQNAFCHPDGARAAVVGADRAADSLSLPGRVLALVDVARRAGLPIYWTRIVNGKPARTRTVATGIERLGGRVDLVAEDDWNAAFLDEVAEVVGDDPVIVKPRASSFHRTDLDARLRAAGVDTLIVTGTTTSFCVEATVRDAFALDYGAVVVSDCVADTDPAAHAASLAIIDRFHGRVVDAATLADELTHS
jgi:ureidoacrylate peracid hydrolase